MKKPYTDPHAEELHICTFEDVLVNSDVNIDIDDLITKERDIPGGALFN